MVLVRKMEIEYTLTHIYTHTHITGKRIIKINKFKESCAQGERKIKYGKKNFGQM